MKSRDKEKYRHKGLREISVNTIMGEIKCKRAIYEIHEERINKRVYLLDEKLKINAGGKVSSNLVEKVIDTTTNTSISHEKIRKIV